MIFTNLAFHSFGGREFLDLIYNKSPNTFYIGSRILWEVERVTINYKTVNTECFYYRVKISVFS